MRARGIGCHHVASVGRGANRLTGQMRESPVSVSFRGLALLIAICVNWPYDPESLQSNGLSADSGDAIIPLLTTIAL
jgi:hypothetical protein